ncbi:hypothetical protein B0H17DRAFT_1324260 [Mycena rosella]|uniref:RNI-like protein n=1 Tax=Mycena rosella TaxID=1033263 RepID=A0AAD7MCK9_MYCRO|nr:hypothetical protein B0H17DRAFT_1324260 [Mycena rosella]
MSLHSPALGPSSPSPSSSAVTIPIPGRSILKKPPPVQASLFSRLSLSRFLPGDAAARDASRDSGAHTTGGGAGKGGEGGEKEKEEREKARVLKRAHFILPEIAVVYPISSLAPPSTPALRDEKRAIEERERERRRRVVRANSVNGGSGSTDTASVLTSSTGTGGGADEGEWWAMDKVESFYRECCEGCQEPPDAGIMAAFKNTPPMHPRSVDFSGVQLTFASASVLADVLSIEWGLRKAVFRECDLDELTLKPLLHALLIPRTLAFLSLASNRRLRGAAWRLVGAYLGKAHALQFLDLSQNALDKKAVECIVGALGEYVHGPAQGVGPSSSAASFISVSDTASIDSRDDRRDGPYGPPAHGDARYGLGYGLDERDRDGRDKDGRDRAGDPHVPGARRGLVSLKLDDCALRAAALETLSRAVRTSSLRNISLRHNRISPTGAVALALMIRDYPDVLNAPGAGARPASPTVGTFEGGLFASPHASPVVPPQQGSGRRRGRGQAPAAAAAPGGDDHGGADDQSAPVPAAAAGRAVVASSVLGGVTARHVPGAGTGDDAAQREREREREREAQKERERDGPSAALLDKVRALDALPRVGALRTLDLRGNDLRTGITYIAQVLKRNRTLKVLNLAENKLDVACLVSLAEALKYNSSLETLDLSRNPCSGPGLEGIQSLRTAFTLNTALKRLFLSATGLAPPGAIALAEFLPESASLLHLDLTENALGVAGVLALSKGLSANFVMRCLDLNIPPGDEECARMCREILGACVRNTEEAERRAGGSGGSGAQTPVEGGAGAGNSGGGGGSINGGSGGSGRGLAKGVWGMIEESELAKSIRLDEEKKIENDVVLRARACVAQLEALLAPPPPAGAPPMPAPTPTPTPADVLKQARALTRELGKVIQETEEPARMEELLDVNDTLTALVARAPPPGRPTLTLQGLGLKWAPGAPVASPVVGNGDAGVASGGANGHAAAGAEDEEAPTTPRIDKGKARAVPAPEEPEKVLSPLMLADDEDDEDGEGRLRFSPVEEDGDDSETVLGTSPTNRSRSWVEEEGEVFRKGTALLGPEEMEGEYAGEDLRKELLEAMVERPPPRPLTDQFGLEIQQPEAPQPNQEAEPPASPQPASPPPRPYISRSRSSSNSIMSMISPTIASFGSGGAQQLPEGQASSPRIPPGPASPSPLGNGVRPYLARRSSSSTLDNR